MIFLTAGRHFHHSVSPVNPAGIRVQQRAGHMLHLHGTVRKKLHTCYLTVIIAI